jgi:hypothetical protein
MPSTPEVKTCTHESAKKSVNKKDSPFMATEKEIKEFDMNKFLTEEE